MWRIVAVSILVANHVKGLARAGSLEEWFDLLWHRPDHVCKCDWDDNFWLYVAADLELLFAGPTEYFFSKDDHGNHSRKHQNAWKLLQQLTLADGLCRVDPSRTAPLEGRRPLFNPGWVQMDESETPWTLVPDMFFVELCVPGMIVADLLCTLHFAFAFQDPQLLRAARHARRLRFLLPWVQHCWTWPWATLNLKDLEEFAERWAKLSESTLPWLETKVMLEELLFRGVAQPAPVTEMPAMLRRCWPPSNGCWPRKSGMVTASCTMCCDPMFTRGDPTCFIGEWTFERCCRSDDPSGTWPPGPAAIELISTKDDQLEELRYDLQLLHASTSTTSGLPAVAEISRAQRRSELRRWLQETTSRSGRQKIFPELDLMVSTNACVGREVEVPWFFISGASEVPGVSVAAGAGALCGEGLEVRNERTSVVGRRALIPSRRAIAGYHKLEPYGLEIMLPCQLSDDTCFCGSQQCSPHMLFNKSCCRDGRSVEWRGLGILTGEMSSNIAHFARDSLWLHGISNETLEALGFPQRKVERVLTKFAATQCLENGPCSKTGSQRLFEMQQLMEEVALDGFPWRTWNAGLATLAHTVCYEVLVQRWRPWAGDVREIQSFRRSALKKCQIRDRGIQKKMVLLKRESFTRRWKDEAQVIENLKSLAVSMGATFQTVNLGRLSPCEQVEALHDVMLMVGVHGADLTNLIFLPTMAAVVEIGVECEVEGASVDSPFWRGPGTLMNHSILAHARATWKEQQRQGLCPPVGSTLPPDQWLQGYPTSQFAKLARQANLLYSAVMDCSGAECHRQQDPGEYDRGWCNSDVKKREFVEVDVTGKLIPTLWVIYDEYLRKLVL